jgi:hypothetical protein
MNDAQTVFPSDKPKGSRKGFVRVDNTLAQDKRLSFGCRGMLLHVLSKPKHFRHSALGLTYQGLEGPHKLEGFIREAIQWGYCKRAKNRTAKGHIESTLTFYETPQPTAENGQSVPTATLPTVGEPTGRSTECRLNGSLLNDPPRNDCLRNDPTKKESVSGKDGTTHTPSFLPSVQTDFPDKDVPAIWQKMLAEYVNKPQRHTEAKLREWCAREFPKQNAESPKGAHGIVLSLKVKPDRFDCTRAYISFFNTFRGGRPEWNDVPDSVRINILEELHPEISGPPKWREAALVNYPHMEDRIPVLFWKDYPDEEHKRQLLKDWDQDKRTGQWISRYRGLTMV